MGESSTDIPKAVILTAIPLEYKAVCEHLVDIKEVEHEKGTLYDVGTFKGDRNTWEVSVAEVGAGNNSCGIETERAIDFFNPKVVMFVGIAGGIKDVTYGDVVVATKAYGYESGKVIKGKLLTRPDLGKSSYGILQRAMAVARKDDWKKRIKNPELKEMPIAITKPIAAGEKVIASTRSEIYNLIRNYYNDTVAVEMEGFGFYEAIDRNEGKQGLIVRGISDLLENKEETDGKGYQVIAAQNACAFAFEVLSRLKI